VYLLDNKRREREGKNAQITRQSWNAIVSDDLILLVDGSSSLFVNRDIGLAVPIILNPFGVGIAPWK
jgi:hypothetical protein